MQNTNHDILKRLSDIQVAYFRQAGNDFEKLDHMQQYLVANVVKFSGPILPPWDKVHHFGTRKYIETYVWEKNPEDLSIFHPEYWKTIVGYPTGPIVAQLRAEREREMVLEEALNEVSTEDILADGAIAGLGSTNEDFIKAKPGLYNEISNYFKVNNFSQVSSDCVNYLLNQYHNGNDFAANTNLYKSANTPLYQNAQNPNRALEWKPDTQAVNEGFTNFGNVLSALFENYPNSAYEGRIIRDMFGVNGINVPNALLNERLGDFFFFNRNTGGTVDISYENNLGTGLYDLGIFTNQFLLDSNNLLPLEFLQQQEPNYFGQVIRNPKGNVGRIHENAFIITNDEGQTLAFVTPDEKFFYWHNENGAYFVSDRGAARDSYDYYVEDKWKRKSEPISWGIHRSADDIGESVLNWISNPKQSFNNFADGMIKIATLDFDIEKSWEALLNADLSDASYFVSSMALAYLSGPKELV